MNDFTAEQAKDIHDIESYKSVTGAKRFRRTKEESSQGLTPEEALEQRLIEFELKTLGLGSEGKPVTKPRKRRASKSLAGTMTIAVRPEAGVDSDYFARLPKQAIELVLDEKWYSWLDTKLEMPYNGDATQLFQHIFNLGIGEVISRVHSAADIKEYN